MYLENNNNKKKLKKTRIFILHKVTSILYSKYHISINKAKVIYYSNYNKKYILKKSQ